MKPIVKNYLIIFLLLGTFAGFGSVNAQSTSTWAAIEKIEGVKSDVKEKYQNQADNKYYYFAIAACSNCGKSQYDVDNHFFISEVYYTTSDEIERAMVEAMRMKNTPYYEALQRIISSWFYENKWEALERRRELIKTKKEQGFMIHKVNNLVISPIAGNITDQSKSNQYDGNYDSDDSTFWAALVGIAISSLLLLFID